MGIVGFVTNVLQILTVCAVSDWGQVPLWGMVVMGLMSGIFGAYVFAKSEPYKGAFAGYLLLFAGWTGLMLYIGVMQGACPIHGTAQVLVFLCWSLLLFYLITGRAYRLSFLGGLTGVLVMLLALVACLTGIEPAVARGSLWGDFHVGFAILAYAALSLSMLASVALLIQNKNLKEHHLEGAYKRLPKLNWVAKSAPKLMLWGIVLLTLSIIFVWSYATVIPMVKLLVASGTWLGYVVLIVVWKWRGLPARWFALWNVVVYVLALTVIFFSR